MGSGKTNDSELIMVDKMLNRQVQYIVSNY